MSARLVGLKVGVESLILDTVERQLLLLPGELRVGQVVQLSGPEGGVGPQKVFVARIMLL